MSFKFMPSRFGQAPAEGGGFDQFGPPAQQSSASTGPRSYGKPPSSRSYGEPTTGAKKTNPASGYRESKSASTAKALEGRANAAYALLIQRVIAEQSLRDYVGNAKKEFEATDPLYAPKQYAERKKKYQKEYGTQLMRLANSIGRVTVEEKTYPGSFFDEQVVVKSLPPEYATLFRNPMVRAAAYDDFLSAITAAQKAAGVDFKLISDTQKFANAKRDEAINSGSGQWGANNLKLVPGAPASWEPVVMAAVRDEAFPQIEYLTTPDQVKQISVWLASAFKGRSSPAALKTLVGNYIADRLGVMPGQAPITTGEIFAPGRAAAGREMAEGGRVQPLPAAAVDRAATEKARKARDEAARQKASAEAERRNAMRRAQQAEADRKKAAAEGRAADEARLSAEKAAAEAAAREAEAKAREAEAKAREAGANITAGPAPSGGGGGSAPSISTDQGATAPTEGEAAPAVTTDAEGKPVIAVPDASVVAPAPAAPAAKTSPVVALLAVAAIGGGIWWYMKNRKSA